MHLGNYDRHTTGNCQGNQVDSPSKMTLRDVLAKPVTQSATSAEVRAAGEMDASRGAGSVSPHLWPGLLYLLNTV